MATPVVTTVAVPPAAAGKAKKQKVKKEKEPKPNHDQPNGRNAPAPLGEPAAGETAKTTAPGEVVSRPLAEDEKKHGGGKGKKPSE